MHFVLNFWYLNINSLFNLCKSYFFFCFQGSNTFKTQDFSAYEFSGSIKNLLPGKAYVFRIQAETRVGYGPESIWKEKLPILGIYEILSQCLIFDIIFDSLDKI